MIGLGELLAKEKLEARFTVFLDVTELRAVHVPELRAPADRKHGRASQIAGVGLLELRGVELADHRLVSGADPGQHRELVKSDVLEALAKRLQRAEISRVALDEEVVQRVFGIERE